MSVTRATAESRRILWVRTALYGVLVQALVLALIFGAVILWSEVGSSPTQEEVDAFFQQAARWIGIGGGALLALWLGRSAAKRASSAGLWNGLLVAGWSIVAAAAVVVATGTPLSGALLIAWAVRIVAGGLGGLTADRSRG